MRIVTWSYLCLKKKIRISVNELGQLQVEGEGKESPEKMLLYYFQERHNDGLG